MAATLGCSVVVVLAVAAAGWSVGFLSTEGTGPGGVARDGADLFEVFLGIVTRNLGAAALLFSGVLTAGTTTAFSLLAIFLFVGATMRFGSDALGMVDLLTPLLAYLPLELGGVLLAAVAGIYPPMRWLRKGSDKRRSEYLRGLRRSLRMLGFSAGMIILAAVLETPLAAAKVGAS